MYKNNLKLLFFLALLCLAAVAACAVKPAAIKDGFLFDVAGCRFYGSFTPPVKPGGSCFILLHGLGSNHNEWDGFRKALKAKGYGCLSYDARGHGKSSADKKGNPVNYRYFINEWRGMAADLGAAVEFLEKNNTGRADIIIAGASLGANIALNYCAGEPSITQLVLLSPGIEYAGIRTPEVISRYAGRLIISASPEDRYAYQSSKILEKAFKGNGFFIEGDGAFHGAGILTVEKIKELLDCIEGNGGK